MAAFYIANSIYYIDMKFDYKPLSRENINGKRHYCTPDGLKLPSVTTILEKTKSQEKIDALNNWRRRVGPQAAQTITTEAAGTGTVMHKMLEEHCLGKAKPPGSNDVQKIAYPMAQTIIQNGLVHMNEVWGKEWIDDYFTQLVFYGTAHNKLYGTQIQQGVVLMCSRACEYQEFVIEGSKWEHYENMMWDKIEQYYKELYK
jgi:hypothetical protein